MKTQRVLHQVVLLVLLVQLFAPLITAPPAQASPHPTPPPMPLLAPQPLAPQAESALQQAQAHTPPQAPPAAQLDDILPPGTIPAAAPLAQSVRERVYLPLVVGNIDSRPRDIALPPDVWLTETAGWEIHELAASVVIRTPSEWRTSVTTPTSTVALLTARSATTSVTITVEKLPSFSIDPPAEHPALAGGTVASTTAVSVKGMPAWQINTTQSTEPLCHDVLVYLGDGWVHIQMARGNNGQCDTDLFERIVSSLQTFSHGDPVVDKPMLVEPFIGLTTAINYNRSAAYNYADVWWSQNNNASGSYYLNADGANFIAHAIEAGGFPIRALAGQPNNAPAVIQIAAQRSYIFSTGHAQTTSADRLRVGDIVYAVGTNGCQGGVVVRMEGGTPFIATHSPNRWNERFDAMACQNGQTYEFVHIESFDDYVLSSGLTLAPAIQATNQSIQASFTVRHLGLQSRNVQLQIQTNVLGILPEQGCTLNPNGTCTYNATITSSTPTPFQACAQINYGSGWLNLPPEGAALTCANGEFRTPANVVVTAGTNVSTNDILFGGGNPTVDFTVQNTGGLVSTESYRAVVVRDSSQIVFPPIENITLNPGESRTYSTNQAVTEPGIYQVFAEQFINGSWLRMIGQQTTAFRVRQAPPPPAQTVKGNDPACGTAGEPVNTSTGNFFADATDLQEPAVGLPMAVTRWYNALDAADVAGPFGFGTAWAYDMRVTYRNDKSALVRMTDGSVAYFLGDLTIDNPLDLAGTYIGQDEDIGTLVREADGTSVLTLPDQTNYHFDANGRIVRISHPHPSEINVVYSGGLPVALQHSAGITFTITYSNGLITEMAASTGRSVQYTYANGDLVQVTRPDGSTYRYEYDANHRLTAAFTPNGSAYVRNFYDDQGRVVRQLDQAGTESFFTYGADIMLPRVFTDTLGFTTTHFYDADYRLIREIDALGHITTYTRDAQSNITAKQDRTGAVWQWTYDTRGNMLTATDPLGNVTTYEYDARNNRTAMLDPLGHRTEYTYDANNRMIAERDALGHTRTFAYDSMGNLIFERDKTGGETRYLHNTQGLPISITNALGQTTLMAYDAFGNTAVYTDAEGRAATFAYDELNRLMSSSDPISASFPLNYDAMGNLLEETNALGEAMTYTYDAFDRVISATDFKGNTTTYEYNALGRTTAITNALGETTRSVYDPVGNLVETIAPDGTSTRYEYDPEQRLIRETDALGRTTEYVYDAAGRQIETREPCDPAVCPTGFATRRTTYDSASRVIAQQDARGAVTQTEYDVLNRVARVIYPDGSRVAYSYDAAGRQIQDVDQVGAVTRIVYDDLGQPINTISPLGFTTIITFDAVGNVLAESNRRGAATTFAYDANDRPAAVTDALGNTTTTTYDAEGRVLSTTDPLGRTTRYAYDANGNQTRIIDPRGNARTTEYDVLDRPIRECDALAQCREMAYDALGRMVAETDALGRTTRYEYDNIGRKVRQISPLGYTTIYTYDLASNLIATEDATGAVTRYEYDANGNQVRQIDPLGQVRRMEYDSLNRMTRMVDELGAVTTMTYDEKGRVIAQTDARGQTTTTTYDAQGRRISTVSPLGHTTVYTYNAMDSLIAVQDAEGFVTTYEYDALDRQIVQRDPLGATRITTYDAAGQTDVEVDYRGNPTSYAFDAAGNTIVIENALSDTTTMTYDRLDRVTSTTDQLGRTSFTGYDALGRVISETTALGFTTVFTYNEEGWLVAQRDALGQTRTTTYDAVGRPLTVTDEAGRMTTYEYDALGRKISETDALGRTTRMRYDAAGRLVQLIAPDGTTQSYTYDPLGNLLSETDANGNTTRYEYDADGRRIRKTDALGHVWLYQYDQRGNQTAVELPSGTRITMTYDQLGRMRELFYNSVREVEFGYDANGNRTFMHDRSGRTSYTYDALNRLIASSDGNNRTAAYGYDAVGQRTSLTYPDGTGATYAYDADGRMVEVREPNSGASTTTYDALNRPTLMRQANGVTIAYVYDPVGNLLEQTHRAPDGTIQTLHQYALNPVNQRTQMIETLPQGTITTTYTYDLLDRLIRSVSSDGRTTSYTLDKVGNRLLQTGTRQRAGITETYRLATDYNALNQLLRSSDSVLGESFYRYDSDGYRTAMFAPNRRDTYTYNAEGRMLEALVEVLDADTESWRVKDNTRERYTYDGLGRRVKREELNHSLSALRVRHEYRYDDGQIWDVLQAYRTGVSDEASERRYLYDTAFHKLATTEDGATRYFQNDGLGSVTGATDSTGSLASPSTMRYDDYGNLLGDESALPTEDAYTGYERDAYTGLHYARNRYYASTTGTFLTPDPYPANYEDMLDLHRYLYVQANPINNTDPLGLFQITSSTTGLIQWGDTLWAISRQLGTSIEHLLQLNPQITNRDLIYAGATLNIPSQQSASNYQVPQQKPTSNYNAPQQKPTSNYNAPQQKPVDPPSSKRNDSSKSQNQQEQQKAVDKGKVQSECGKKDRPINELYRKLEGEVFTGAGVRKEVGLPKKIKDLLKRLDFTLPGVGKFDLSKTDFKAGFSIHIGPKLAQGKVSLCFIGEAYGEFSGPKFPLYGANINLWSEGKVEFEACPYNTSISGKVAFGIDVFLGVDESLGKVGLGIKGGAGVKLDRDGVILDASVEGYTKAEVKVGWFSQKIWDASIKSDPFEYRIYSWGGGGGGW